MSRFLQCPDCHGIALVIYGEEDAGCGTYDKLHANTTDAALEKHLPVVEVKKMWSRQRWEQTTIPWTRTIILPGYIWRPPGEEASGS